MSNSMMFVWLELKYKKTLQFFLVILSLSACNVDHTQEYFETPRTGDIYIFGNEGIYLPERLIEVSEDSSIYSFVEYQFIFTEAIPKENQILADEFIDEVILYYDSSELLKLWSENRIVKIYRPKKK